MKVVILTLLIVFLNISPAFSQFGKPHVTVDYLTEYHDNQFLKMGTVAANTPFEICAESEGKILSTQISEGAYVTKGTPLMQMDDRLLRKDLQAIEIGIDMNAEKIKQLREMLKRGYLPPEPEPESDDNDRRRRKHKKNVSKRETKEEKPLTEKELKRLKAIEEEERKEQERLNKHREEAWIKDIKNEIKMLKMDIDRLETERGKVLFLMDQKEIKAPNNATVIKSYIHSGGWLRPGQPVAELVRNDIYNIWVDIEEGLLGRISRNQAVEVFFQDNTYIGRVSGVMPDRDPVTNMPKVKVTINSVPHRHIVLSGSQVTVNFDYHSTPRYLVPADAVTKRFFKDCIFIVNKGKATRCFINVIGTKDGKVMIQGSSLKQGMEIITSEHGHIQNGQNVIIDY